MPFEGEMPSPTRTWVADVLVVPKEGVNDPEGEAIRAGLQMLGNEGIDRVRAGRYLQLHLSAADAEVAGAAVAAMCEQLLANPVIETYQISVTEVVEECAATMEQGRQ